MRLNWKKSAAAVLIGAVFLGCQPEHVRPAVVPAPVSNTAMFGAADGSRVWIYNANSSTVVYCSTLGTPSCLKLQPQ